MASPEQFARKMDKLGKRIEDNAGRVLRKCALAVDAAVVIATPVDTGRARANWQVELNAPAEGVTDDLSPSGRESIAKGKEKISEYKPTKDTSIHITNNLPYIGALNNGSSAQAPQAFVEKAVMVGVSAVRGAKVTTGTVNDN